MDHNVQIDTSQTYLLIEARNSLAREAFNLEVNRSLLAPVKQTRQNRKPTKAAPSGKAPTITLQLRLNKEPVNSDSGHVFGSSEGECDVLLDTSSSRGVSPKAFTVELDRGRGIIVLTCQAANGVFFWRDTENAKPRHLRRGDRCHVRGGRNWVVAIGNVRIALIPIVRDNDVQSAYHKNFYAYKGSLIKEMPDVEQLRIEASDLAPQPITEDLKGIRGKYTTAGAINHGGGGNIMASFSNIHVKTLCIKKAKPVKRVKFDVQEAKPGKSDVKKAKTGKSGVKKVQQGKSNVEFVRDIVFLRKLAHPSVVQYFDRDQQFEWMAIELVKGGDLEGEHAIKPFTMRETEVLTYQVLDALSHIHSCGIVHRDINPSNILVQTRTESQILVKIADFGDALKEGEHPEKNIGTQMYQAPELFERSVHWGVKIDVWALAVVALELMFGLPDQSESDDGGVDSFLVGGWDGSLVDHLHDNAAAYVDANPEAIDQFFETLSDMFELDPEARVSALEACQSLRRGYPVAYFLSLGIGNAIPVIADPALPAGASDDDSSIFRFRELPVKGRSEPLLMLEGCYLVSMTYVMEAVCQETPLDIEEQTLKELENPRYGCWRFKITNRFPERYVEIELARKICMRHLHLQPVVDVLNTQQTLRDRARTEFAALKGKKALKSDQTWTGTPQLDLIESISSRDNIIAITEQGHMILVRASDAYLHDPSLEAIEAERLLATDDASDPDALYIPLEEAMRYPGLVSHNDIISLGAATYTSY